MAGRRGFGSSLPHHREHENGVTFLESDRTWVAIRPLGASAPVRDDEPGRQLLSGKHPRFPAHQVLS